MFQSLLAQLPRDKDYPARQFRIDALTRVLRGTLYDHLQHDFHHEQETGTQRHIPIRERRPCVRSGLCKVVVDHSVSLLFAEGQFPSLDCEDAPTCDALRALIKDSRLNAVMIEAATVGSVGSVAILLRVLNGRAFFSVMNTQFLTPLWRHDAPDTLASVTEQYKVKGQVLQQSGYDIDEPEADYWFRRTWDAQWETRYRPWPVNGGQAGKTGKAAPMRDGARSLRHGLGFVPLVWVKNLPGGDAIDGACTFEAAINTVTGSPTSCASAMAKARCARS